MCARTRDSRSVTCCLKQPTHTGAPSSAAWARVQWSVRYIRKPSYPRLYSKVSTFLVSYSSSHAVLPPQNIKGGLKRVEGKAKKGTAVPQAPAPASPQARSGPAFGSSERGVEMKAKHGVDHGKDSCYGSEMCVNPDERSHVARLPKPFCPFPCLCLCHCLCPCLCLHLYRLVPCAKCVKLSSDLLFRHSVRCRLLNVGAWQCGMC